MVSPNNDNVDNVDNDQESSLSGTKEESEEESNDVRCHEYLPTSDSNKENLTDNVLSQSCVSSDWINEHDLTEYNNTSQIPLPQLLKIHMKHLVSGFEFGEATKRHAQENMKSARMKKLSEKEMGFILSPTEIDDEEKPEELKDIYEASCSKTFLEQENKTPHSRKRQPVNDSEKNVVNLDRDFPTVTRRVPECLAKYPDCKEVWMFMIFKEEASLKLRNPRLFNDFTGVTPRMRAILLDWLMEVAAVYNLRRVTYYLSVDYFDRFLSIRPDIPKSLLQLVGITCLYIAAKVEEIYPPNLNEFSYVCDGACKSEEMVSCELLILNSLGWEVVLTTPSDWLNLYMQLHFKSTDIAKAGLSMDFNKDFIFPQYSAYQFTRASQLMDLLSLDPGFLKFGYSFVAASAMYYMFGKNIALSVSGLLWQDLEPCVSYMEVIHRILKDTPDPRLESCLGGPSQESHKTNNYLKKISKGSNNENYSFQTHIASMEYFEKATIYRLSLYARAQSENAERNLDKTSETDLKETNSDGVDSFSEDLKNLQDLTDVEDGTNSANENLLSLDEIFEMILSEGDSTKNGANSTNVS